MAQVQTSELHVIVKDAKGAVVRDATVTAAESGQGPIAVTRRPTPKALAILLSLPPGLYSVTVEAPGFAKLVNRVPCASPSARSRSCRLTLSVAAATETVTVSSEAELVETQQTASATTIDQNAHRQPADQRPQLHQFRADQLATGARHRAQHRCRADLGLEHRRTARPQQPGQHRRHQCHRQLHQRHSLHRLARCRAGVPDPHQRLRRGIRTGRRRRDQHHFQVRAPTSFTAAPSDTCATATSRRPIPSATSISRPTRARNTASLRAARSRRTAPTGSSPTKAPTATRAASTTSALTTSDLAPSPISLASSMPP